MKMSLDPRLPLAATGKAGNEQIRLEHAVSRRHNLSWHHYVGRGRSGPAYFAWPLSSVNYRGREDRDGGLRRKA